MIKQLIQSLKIHSCPSAKKSRWKVNKIIEMNLWITCPRLIYLLQVTWVRRRDRQLLTVGTATHSVDNRFMIRVSSSDWALVIRRVTLDDAGLYECQVINQPISQSTNQSIIQLIDQLIINHCPDCNLSSRTTLCTSGGNRSVLGDTRWPGSTCQARLEFET